MRMWLSAVRNRIFFYQSKWNGLLYETYLPTLSTYQIHQKWAAGSQQRSDSPATSDSEWISETFTGVAFLCLLRCFWGLMLHGWHGFTFPPACPLMAAVPQPQMTAWGRMVLKLLLHLQVKKNQPDTQTYTSHAYNPLYMYIYIYINI